MHIHVVCFFSYQGFLLLLDKKNFVSHVQMGVRGQVLKVVDFKPLAPHRCGFESLQGLWILSCEEAIKLAYGT
jgi:hypothetical protein